MKDIELISFDAADTLIKLAVSIGDHYAYVAGRYGVIAEVEEINKSFKQVFASTAPLNEQGQKGFTWWTKVIAQTFAGLGFSEKDFGDFENFVSELYAELEKENAWVVYPDVEPCLKYLQSLDFRMVVFSNFDERLIKILHDLNLNIYFEQIICSTQIGYAKPDPKAFLKLAEIVNLKPQKILHIGDGFENDYLGSLRADFKALYLNRSGLKIYKPLNPKNELNHLTEIEEIFPKINIRKHYKNTRNY